MKNEETSPRGDEPSIDTLREHAREAVVQGSLRGLARQAEISVETLRKFISEGAVPHGRTVERLRRWYARESALTPYGATPGTGLYGGHPAQARPHPRRAPRVQPPASVGHAGTDADRVAVRLHSARRAFESDAELADFLGVDRAQPARWRAGQAPDPVNRERIVALDVVIELLGTYLSPTSIPKWLNGVNAHLGNRRPIAVLRAGRLSEVIAAIEAERSGAFA